MNPQEVAKKQADWPQAFSDSRALFASGKYEQAEKELLRSNLYATETAEGSFEAALALYRVALSFRQTGDVSLSIVVAQRALDYLDKANKKPEALADSELASRITEQIGAINERLVGTTTAAKAFYRTAVQLNPNAVTASAALQRLDKADQEAALKQKGKKNNGVD
jgi:tetratricopeptide (TPR) repeat protein